MAATINTNVSSLTAQRNLGTVTECLDPLVNGAVPAKYVLELASFPYEHIRGYAKKWPHVHFSGTVRDLDEMEYVIG